MNTYYINGNKVGVDYAKARFVAFHACVTGLDGEGIENAWRNCQRDEATRD